MLYDTSKFKEVMMFRAKSDCNRLFVTWLHALLLSSYPKRWKCSNVCETAAPCDENPSPRYTSQIHQKSRPKLHYSWFRPENKLTKHSFTAMRWRKILATSTHKEAPEVRGEQEPNDGIGVRLGSYTLVKWSEKYAQRYTHGCATHTHTTTVYGWRTCVRKFLTSFIYCVHAMIKKSKRE